MLSGGKRGWFIWVEGGGVVEVGIGWEGGVDSEEGEMVREGRLFGLFPFVFFWCFGMCYRPGSCLDKDSCLLCILKLTLRVSISNLFPLRCSFARFGGAIFDTILCSKLPDLSQRS